MPNIAVSQPDLIDTVVNMTVYEIATDQICAATGLSAEQLAELKTGEEFKSALAIVSAEDFEKSSTLNDAWDNIEAASLTVIQDTLEFSRDPDFALRAAVHANKARRRGSQNDRQIDAPAGVRTVINLSAQFIEKMQSLTVNGAVTSRITEKKMTDSLNPKQVEELLELKTEEEQSAEQNLIESGAQFCMPDYN